MATHQDLASYYDQLEAELNISNVKSTLPEFSDGRLTESLRNRIIEELVELSPKYQSFLPPGTDPRDFIGDMPDPELVGTYLEIYYGAQEHRSRQSSEARIERIIAANPALNQDPHWSALKNTPEYIAYWEGRYDAERTD